VDAARNSIDEWLSTRFRKRVKILLGRLRRFAILPIRESLGR
jgi:hypothetical protein